MLLPRCGGNLGAQGARRLQIVPPALRHALVQHPQGLRRAAPPLAAFSAPVQEQLQQLQQLLLHRLYRHPDVLRNTTKAQRLLTELFEAYHADPRLLPRPYQREDAARQPRAIADYLAGMTDRYAIREHQRLFSMRDWPVY